ncbi:MAG: carbon starvation protein A [Candidatus Omnitrophica bacterium]|nr:carbon starvation protein A [Candidatus Omnitrophota bacterium]
MINSLHLIIISCLVFFLGYIFYRKRLFCLWEVDSKNKVPAFYKYDGIDYVPAKNWLVLFGHHFSSIAGAGPIIGPVIACFIWGWVPAIIWVVLGTVFIGGIHDFSSLIVSVKEEGSSISEISKNSISFKAKVMFSLFVWMALILVIAVFAFLCAKTFISEPKIILPSLGLIPLAVLIGAMLYNLKLNSILVSIFGIVAFFFLIVLGNIFSINLGKNSLYIWLGVLFFYAYFASILPVNILLQPRDYLCSFLLFFGMFFGILGVIITHPAIKMPLFIKWNNSEGWLWPSLFVTVACGAISGFHSLISSGTTSKQLPNEKFSFRIGYGAMVMEGLLATLVIVMISSLNLSKDSLDFYLKTKGPIEIFSQGYSLVTKKFLGGFAVLIAMAMLNSFILTTLDTASRICRYITEELFLIKNRFLSTALVLSLSALLAFTGQWVKIWPAFGASNQLVASLSLFVISAWLINRNKTASFTLPIAIFMFFTTIGALVFQFLRHLLQKDYLLLFICGILIILGGLMFLEIMNKICRKR